MNSRAQQPLRPVPRFAGTYPPPPVTFVDDSPVLQPGQRCYVRIWNSRRASYSCEVPGTVIQQITTRSFMSELGVRTYTIETAGPRGQRRRADLTPYLGQVWPAGTPAPPASAHWYRERRASTLATWIALPTDATQVDAAGTSETRRIELWYPGHFLSNPRSTETIGVLAAAGPYAGTMMTINRAQTLRPYTAELAVALTERGAWVYGYEPKHGVSLKRVERRG